MASFDFWDMLGFSNNAVINMDVFGGASAIITTDNPEYTVSDFTATFPIFPVSTLETQETGKIPLAVFTMFKTMADKSIKYDRYHSTWKYLTGLYIAHYLYLYVKTQEGTPSFSAALKNSIPTGVITSKSVDGLSVSIDFPGMSDDMAGYGSWKLTTYGQQLITLTKPLGHVGMWVNF